KDGVCIVNNRIPNTRDAIRGPGSRLGGSRRAERRVGSHNRSSPLLTPAWGAGWASSEACRPPGPVPMDSHKQQLRTSKKEFLGHASAVASACPVHEPAGSSAAVSGGAGCPGSAYVGEGRARHTHTPTICSRL